MGLGRRGDNGGKIRWEGELGTVLNRGLRNNGDGGN